MPDLLRYMPDIGLISHTSFYMVIFLDSNNIKHDYLYSALCHLQYAEYKTSAVSLTRSSSINILNCSLLVRNYYACFNAKW